MSLFVSFVVSIVTNRNSNHLILLKAFNAYYIEQQAISWNLRHNLIII